MVEDRDSFSEILLYSFPSLLSLLCSAVAGVTELFPKWQHLASLVVLRSLNSALVEAPFM